MSDDRVTDGAPVTLEELEGVLRRHEGPPHARSRPAEAMVDGSPEPSPRPPRWRRPRLAWTLAAIAAALLVGSGLGFGVGSAVTPSGSAGTNVVGFGFLPARGWTVVQTGTIGSTGTATAIAANVSLHPDDDVRGVPRVTLASLPVRGVVIRAVFTTRGDPAQDLRFPVASLPLDFAAAEPVAVAGDAAGEYHLRAAVGGHNVDARIYLGSSVPSAALAAAAQQQLSRLVVAAERVTIRARPTAARWGVPFMLFGTVDNGRANEVVDIQARDCGSSSNTFHGVAGTRTHDGGTWSIAYAAGITTTLRAVWNDEASTQVTVRQRPYVLLLRRMRGVFEVQVRGKRQFWLRRAELQRFDRRLGRWTLARKVVLTEQVAAGQGYITTSARFRASVPKGTLVRAVFPLSQSRPCYLAGTSNTVRA